MPRMQVMAAQLNVAFGPEAISEIDPERFAPGAGSLAESFAAVPGVRIDDAERAWLDGWPSALQAALQAALYDNLTRPGTVPVTFSWAPGYDYDLRIWDILDTAETHGGITVQVTSRYPGDEHPLTRARSSSA